MKKIFSFFAAVLFAGSMMAEGLLFEQTYPGEPSSKVSSYSKTFTLTTNGYMLTYANINNGSSSDSWDAVRAGSKNGESVATITSEQLSDKVSKVVINFTQINAANTNALYLQVADNAEFSNAEKIDATIATGEVAFVIAEPAENQFYQVVLDMQKGSANGFNRWNKIQFFSSEGGTIVPPTVYDTLTVAQAKDTANALADNVNSKKFYIEGYAVNVGEYSTLYNNQTFYLVDDAAAPDSILQAFRLSPTKGGKAYPVLEGDKLRLFGSLKKYVKDAQTQLEIVDATIEFLEEVEGDRTISVPEAETITIARALQIGDSIGSGNTTAGQYIIEGYVNAVTDNKGNPTTDGGWAQYGNQCMWVSDSFDEAAITKETAFFIYQGVASEQITKHAKIQFTCAIKNYNGMIENAVSKMAITILEKGDDPVQPTDPDTITVAQALEIGKALADKAVSPEKYVITGYVSYIYSFFSKDFNNETVWISDDPENTTTENAFEIYRGKPNTAAEVGWGAKVKIVCQIKNYGGTIENDGVNLPFEVLEASPYVPDTLSIEEAVDIANALGEDAKTPKYHVIKGFIQDAPLPYNYKGSDNKWKNTTIKMSQFPNEQEGPLAVYKANILKADTAKLVQNSYAYVLGYLTKHGGAQVAEGSNVEFVEAPDMDTVHVNVAEALAIGTNLPVEGKSDRIYAVTGFVNSVDGEFAEGVETFYMADDAASEAMNFLVLDVAIEAEAPVGQKVEVVGRLQNADGETVTIENGKARLLWPEGIESIVLTEKAQKVVVDGVIYIVRDNKLFNLQGAQVR